MAERDAGSGVSGPPDPAAPTGSDDPLVGAAMHSLRQAAADVEVERSTAETLQRSLLRERLPEVAGVRLAARYQPGSTEARIGGDWYDVVELRDGRVALVIGDVVGRGIQAAARMAHLQSAVRAYVLEGLRPSLVLERMNAFVGELEHGGSATLALAVIDPDAETVRIASAGHPPPLLAVRGSDAGATFAEGIPGTPLGAADFPTYDEMVLPMPAGSMLVLYTDGLVERPDLALEDGLARLAEVGSKLPEDPEAAAAALVTSLLEREPSGDDVAIVLARLDPPPAELELVVPADPTAQAGVRRALARWMRAMGVSDSEAYELQVACGEACANAIAHAYAPGEANFEVRARREGEAVTIEVADSGTWQPSRGEGGGRGLALIESLTDSYDIERAATGTTVRMHRAVEGAPA